MTLMISNPATPQDTDVRPASWDGEALAGHPMVGHTARHLLGQHGGKAICLAERAICRLHAAGDVEATRIWLAVHAAMVSASGSMARYARTCTGPTPAATRH